MTTNLVPRDIFLQQENEWQAVRRAAEEMEDIGMRASEFRRVVQNAMATAPKRAPQSADYSG